MSFRSDLICSVLKIFRHGERNPQISYPTDPWKDVIHWPEGWGQLSKVSLS